MRQSTNASTAVTTIDAKAASKTKPDMPLRLKALGALNKAPACGSLAAMWRVLAASILVLGVAHAQAPPTTDIVAAEARIYADLPGPYPNTTRTISFWRAPSAPPGPLPTLYMADGGRGLTLAAALIRAEIEAGRMAPIQIIGVATDPERRQAEYVHRGTRQYEAHERWWLDVVIPWAEQHVAASPHHRVIGGYSNGADFALAMASAHPDVFAGVLAHSPVASAAFDMRPEAARVRWAVSAGRREFAGDAARSLGRVSAAARRLGAPARLCVGTWGHTPEAWADLSPGAIAWLFGAQNHAEIATSRERDACRVINDG